jgi:hypothetical protein
MAHLEPIYFKEQMNPINCSYCFLAMFEENLPPEYRITVGMSLSRILELEGAIISCCAFKFHIITGV